MNGRRDLSLWDLHRQGLAGPLLGGPTCRLQGFWRRSGCVPAEPYPPQKQADLVCQQPVGATKTLLARRYSPFDRTVGSPFDRTTTRLIFAGVSNNNKTGQRI